MERLMNTEKMGEKQQNTEKQPNRPQLHAFL